MKKLIAGNWKMNLDLAGAAALAGDISGHPDYPATSKACDLLICPPFPYLGRLNLVPGLSLGAQDCAAEDNGAYTGDVSARMLKDLGCAYVILGHSERRQHHGETDAHVAAKAAKAHEHGLIAIICIGETWEEREKGQAQDVVGRHLRDSLPPSATSGNTVIAYEPVWAIGTGKTATPKDAGEMHAFIRGRLPGPAAKGRILYGGSIKPENAAELLAMPDIDGGLIGGASLKADQFISIAKSAQND
jgi:triosephosphate isomerase (TIM)